MKKLTSILMSIFFASIKCYSQCATPAFDQGTSQTICQGETTQISVQNWCSGCTYAWSNSDAGINISVSPSATTSYDVTVTCTNGSTATSTSHIISVNSNSTAPSSINPTQNPICAGQTIQLTKSGGSLGAGAQYEWYSGSCGGTYVSSGVNIAISPISTTTYYVRAEGTCNTTSCASVTITIDSATTPIIQQGSSVSICQGETTQLTVGNWCSGCSYLWSDGQAGINIPVTQAGSYGVVVTDTNGCQATSLSTSVSVNPNPILNASSTNDAGSCNGTSTASASSGTIPYTYSWSNGCNSAICSGLCAGTYSVTVTDVNGCGISGSVIVENFVGVEKIDFLNNLNVYPNPNTGKFFIEVLKIQDLEIKVFDVLGKIVYENRSFKEKIEIDLSENREGIYFIEVGNVRKKILVIR